MFNTKSTVNANAEKVWKVLFSNFPSKGIKPFIWKYCCNNGDLFFPATDHDPSQAPGNTADVMPSPCPSEAPPPYMPQSGYQAQPSYQAPPGYPAPLGYPAPGYQGQVYQGAHVGYVIAAVSVISLDLCKKDYALSIYSSMLITQIGGIWGGGYYNVTGKLGSTWRCSPLVFRVHLILQEWCTLSQT